MILAALLATAASASGAPGSGRALTEECDAIRAARSISPDGGCAALADDGLACEAAYFTKTPTADQPTSILALCGMVDGQCRVASTVACDDEPSTNPPGSISVDCERFEDVVEDHAAADFSYGICTTSAGDQYVISAAASRAIRPASGARTTLVLMPAQHDSEDATSKRLDGPVPSYVLNGQMLYDLVADKVRVANAPTKQNANVSHPSTNADIRSLIFQAEPSTRRALVSTAGSPFKPAAANATHEPALDGATQHARRALSMRDEHDSLTVRLEYNDASPR